MDIRANPTINPKGLNPNLKPSTLDLIPKTKHQWLVLT